MTRPPRTRRSLLRTGALAGALGTAGCVTDLAESAAASVGATPTVETLSYPDGFEAETARLESRYGDAGLWGLDDGPSVGPGVEYVGAWQDTTSVPAEASGDGRFGTLAVAALVYRLAVGGETRYRVWLWAALTPRQREGRLGRASATRLVVSARPGAGWSLTAFAPRRSTREGPVRVAVDDRGPAARTALPGGGIAPDVARAGPDGELEVAWQGVAGDPRSVNAVCAFGPVEGGEASESFSPSVGARGAVTRGVL